MASGEWHPANGIMTRRSTRIESLTPSFNLANMAAREPPRMTWPPEIAGTSCDKDGRTSTFAHELFIQSAEPKGWTPITKSPDG